MAVCFDSCLDNAQAFFAVCFKGQPELQADALVHFWDLARDCPDHVTLTQIMRICVKRTRTGRPFRGEYTAGVGKRYHSRPTVENVPLANVGSRICPPLRTAIAREALDDALNGEDGIVRGFARAKIQDFNLTAQEMQAALGAHYTTISLHLLAFAEKHGFRRAKLNRCKARLQCAPRS